MNNNDSDHLSDWMAGPGGVVAAIVIVVIAIGLLVSFLGEIF
ncbi:hypothetical protein [Ornithinimicrobium murale]|nr:hypothetical protein [Ornithinimicrobium murale]